MDGDPLLDSRALETKSRLQRWRRHLNQDVEESWADLILLVLCLISGIVDSAVFNVWSCFVSMQTGERVSGSRGQGLTYEQEILSMLGWVCRINL
jgi:hypothetical protein